MDSFFGIDGKFFKWCTYFGDVFLLSIIWSIVTIPVITFGAATTGFYYVATRQLSDREGYITGDFFKSFKSNFFEATAATIIFAVMFGAVYFNLSHTDKTSILFWAQFIILYEIFITALWLFPVLSRFEFKLIPLFKRSFQLANMHLLSTITVTALFAVSVWLCLSRPLLIVICVGVYGVLSSMIFMRVFKKYIPDMDTDDEDEFDLLDDFDEID